MLLIKPCVNTSIRLDLASIRPQRFQTIRMKIGYSILLALVSWIILGLNGALFVQWAADCGLKQSLEAWISNFVETSHFKPATTYRQYITRLPKEVQGIPDRNLRVSAPLKPLYGVRIITMWALLPSDDI